MGKIYRARKRSNQYQNIGRFFVKVWFMDMRKKIFVSLAFLCFGVLYCASQSTPATVPYFCGFEESAENSNWILNAGNAAIVNHPKFVNKWTIGFGAKKVGYQGLYIHTENDPSLAVYGETAMYTVAYREFDLPVGTYDLAFSWRALGEKDADEMIVYWMPATIPTNANLMASAPANWASYKVRYADGKNESLSGSAAWQYATATVSVSGSMAVNQRYKLVFLWRNNNLYTYNPGGCIDNVQLSSSIPQGDCGNSPTSLQYSNENEVFTVFWDGVTGATYDLLYWMDGEAMMDSVMALRQTSYSVSSSNMNTGLYTVWVRAVCPDGTTSLWSELSNVKILGSSSGLVSACPEITFMSNDIDAVTGVKLIVPSCGDEPFSIKPTIVGGGGSIAGYRVEKIPYDPPFPLDAGQPFKVNGGWADDVWSDIIELPFGFCFFDGTYNQAQVGANGLITFNTMSLTGSRNFCEYDLSGSTNIPTQGFIYKNSIFGVYEDGHAGSIEDGGIYYGILGEAPCRTLTVSWDRVPTYGSVKDICTPRKENSYQIVLYEGTNVIDVYIKNRYLCSEWNGGVGIVGLINRDGTDGLAAPGRNTLDSWEVDAKISEGWRFFPLTTPTYEITWYEGMGFNGRIIGKDDSLMLKQADGIDMITVRMQFTACNGDYFDLADTARIVWQQVDTLTTEYVEVCDGESYSNEYIENAGQGYHEVVLKNIRGCDSLIYRLDIGVAEATHRTKDTMICYGETCVFNGIPYTKTGEYLYNHKYVGGCDSVIDTLRLTVLPRIQYYAQIHDAVNGPNSGSITLSLKDDSYYYTLNGEKNAPLNGLSEGEYTLVVYDRGGCQTDPEVFEIVAECLDASLVLPVEQICSDQHSFTLPIDKRSGNISGYSIVFNDKARLGGFKDILQQTFQSDQTGIEIALPEQVMPGHYRATLTLHDMNCEDKVFPFEFSVLYKASTVEQKWNDVLAVLNSKYNGGYEFSSFRWYRNGDPLSDNGSYLYLGMGNSFSEGDCYQVGLVRQNETEEVLTCPICPVYRSEEKMLNVVKTRAAWQLESSRIQNGKAYMYNVMGTRIAEAIIKNGYAVLPVPLTKGVYLVEALSVDMSNREIIRVMKE